MSCGTTTCFHVFQPRYKRLVNNIFPPDPALGLVRSNMDKLSFYVKQSPGKLDRIGKWLAHRLRRDLSRQRLSYVIIAVEAFDILLETCSSAKSLNLFVESFLKMVQRLLESSVPDMQCLAVMSFTKFANIKEDTPSYHRRYDFFVSIFSSLCHSGEEDVPTRSRLRIAGLRGLQGVIHKTIADDLQCNIWQSAHMNKIVPSLLVNLQDSTPRSTVDDAKLPDDEELPMHVAAIVFHELIVRASFGNINDVIQPVLGYLDDHTLWVPNDFAVHCFKLIMSSVQIQYGCAVVHMVMSHLSKNCDKEAAVRTSIVQVLSDIVITAAEASIGPNVLDVFDTLLRHLRLSVDSAFSKSDAEAGRERDGDANRSVGELQFQEAVVTAIGEFASNLPDYQTIQIIEFVMSKISLSQTDSDAGGEDNVVDVQWQLMVLKSLLQIATRYKTTNMMNAFPKAFLEPLLSMSQNANSNVRTVVHRILHVLLDRHGNLSKLQPSGVIGKFRDLNFVLENPTKQDIFFIQKNGSLFYSCIYANLQLNNSVDNIESIWTTLALLALEFCDNDVFLDHIRLVLGIQQLAATSQLPSKYTCTLQAFVALHLYLVAQLMAVPELSSHVENVIDIRKREVPHLLPAVAFTQSLQALRRPSIALPDVKRESWLFNADVISKILSDCDFDISQLSTPFVDHLPAMDKLEDTHSICDSNAFFHDNESTSSSPRLPLRSRLDDISVDSLKKALENDPDDLKMQQEEQQRIFEMFHTGPFEEIVARSEAKSTKLHKQLNEILDLISSSSATSQQATQFQRSVWSTAATGETDSDSEVFGANQSRTASPTFAVAIPDMHFPALIVH